MTTTAESRGVRMRVRERVRPPAAAPVPSPGARLLGLLRLAIEGLLYVLLIGGCFTYGWATTDSAPVANALMLLAGAYVAAVWASGHWQADIFPAAGRWLLAGAALAAYVGLQAMPVPWSYRPDFAAAADAPDVAGALATFNIEPTARLVALDPETATEAALKFIGWLGVALAAMHLARHRPVALRFLGVLAAFGLLQGLLGWQTFSNTRFAAATGTLYNRNHYGALMGILLPLMFASLRVLSRRGGALDRPLLSGENPVVLAYLGIAAAVGGLVASTSRGAFFLGGAACAGYLLHQYLVDRRDAERIGSRRRRADAPVTPTARLHWLGGILGVAVAVAAAIGGALFILGQRGGVGALTIGMRFDYWLTGGRILGAHPLFGIGPGATRRLVNIYSSDFTETEIVHLHSDWIEFALELGALGVVLAVVLVVRAAWTTRATWAASDARPNGATMLVRRAALWSLVAAAATALVDFHLRLPLVAVVVAMTLALWTSFGWRRRRLQAVAATEG